MASTLTKKKQPDRYGSPGIIGDPETSNNRSTYPERRLMFPISASHGQLPKDMLKLAKAKKKETYFVGEIVKKKKKTLKKRDHDGLDVCRSLSRSRSKKKKLEETTQHDLTDRRLTKADNKSASKKKIDLNMKRKKSKGTTKALGLKKNSTDQEYRWVHDRDSTGDISKPSKNVFIKHSKIHTQMLQNKIKNRESGRGSGKDQDQKKTDFQPPEDTDSSNDVQKEPIRLKPNSILPIREKPLVADNHYVSHSESSRGLRLGNPTPSGIEAKFLKLAQENELRWKSFLENLNDLERNNNQNSFVKKVREYKTKVEVCIKAVQGVVLKDQDRSIAKGSPLQLHPPNHKAVPSEDSNRGAAPVEAKSQPENQPESDMPVKEEAKKLELEDRKFIQRNEQYLITPSAIRGSEKIHTDRAVASNLQLKYAQEVWRSPTDSKVSFSSGSNNLQYGSLGENKYIKPTSRLWRAYGLQSLSLIEVQNSSKLHKSIERRGRALRKPDKIEKEIYTPHSLDDNKQSRVMTPNSVEHVVSFAEQIFAKDKRIVKPDNKEEQSPLLEQNDLMTTPEKPNNDKIMINNWEGMVSRGSPKFDGHTIIRFNKELAVNTFERSPVTPNNEISVLEVEPYPLDTVSLSHKEDAKLAQTLDFSIKDQTGALIQNRNLVLNIMDGSNTDKVAPSPMKDCLEDDSVDIKYSEDICELNKNQPHVYQPDENVSVLFTTIEEKADIITSFILENLIVEAIAEDHCVEKFIHILGPHLRQLERNDVEFYFSELFKLLLEDPEEQKALTRRLNTPLSQNDMHRLLLASAVLTEEDHENLGTLHYEPVMDIKLYVQLEERLKESEYGRRGYDPLEMEREHILHKAIFDTLNEELDHQRRFGIHGPPLKISPRFRDEPLITLEKARTITQKAQHQVIDWSVLNAGTFLHKEPQLAHSGELEELERLRDKKMLKLVDDYVD